MASHLVTLTFDGDVPTLNTYAQAWGEGFRLSALADPIRHEAKRRKGAVGSDLTRVSITIVSPVEPMFWDDLARSIEESLVLPASGMDRSVEVEIITSGRTERFLVDTSRPADLDQIRTACERLRQSR